MKNDKTRKSQRGKKSIFKRWWFWVITAIIVIGVIGGGSNKGTQPSETSERVPLTETVAISEVVEASAPVATEGPVAEVLDNVEEPMASIERVIRGRINDKYTYSDISRITINENLGTDAEGDYIALVYITWTQKNSGKTSKEVLKLYSDDLAATIAQECDDIQEIAIFWTVPYLNNANAKCSYERKNGGMYEMDMLWDNAFNS